VHIKSLHIIIIIIIIGPTWQGRAVFQAVSLMTRGRLRPVRFIGLFGRVFSAGPSFRPDLMSSSKHFRVLIN